ncbi:MAG: peptide deformylase [Thermoleophilaceae bacterium]
MVREVLRYPNALLKQVCRPADREEAVRVAEDLLDTMRSFPGCVGIAAPQIGEAVRIAVVDVSEHPRAETSNGLLILVNPRIEHAEGAALAREGCLSIPDLTANVRRATTIRVRAGGVRAECHGFEARCVQHELDHLDGVLFLDRVDSLAHDLFLRQVYR